MSYHRTARTLETSDGPARLTLDHQTARGADRSAVASRARPRCRFFDDRTIVEIKYRVQLPAVFKRLIEEFALEPQSASKYRLGMAALGYAPSAQDGPALSATDASYA